MMNESALIIFLLLVKPSITNIRAPRHADAANIRSVNPTWRFVSMGEIDVCSTSPRRAV
jgi:hypothetical protein